MSGSKSRREHSDEILITALAGGATQVEAGHLAHVSDRTVRRRRDEPAFVELVRKRRTEMLQQAAGQSAALMSDAVAVLRASLQSDSETIRLRAAQLVIDVARRLVTEDEIIERLHRLEQAVKSDEDPTS